MAPTTADSTSHLSQFCCCQLADNHMSFLFLFLSFNRFPVCLQVIHSVLFLGSLLNGQSLCHEIRRRRVIVRLVLVMQPLDRIGSTQLLLYRTATTLFHYFSCHFLAPLQYQSSFAACAILFPIHTRIVSLSLITAIPFLSVLL